MGQRRIRQRVVPILVVLSVLVGVWFSFAPLLTARWLESDYGAAASRFTLFHVAWSMLSAHPLLGVGVNRFTWEFVPYHAVSAGQTLSEDHIANSPHNEFLRYAAEEGVPLAVLYLLGWLAFLAAWWRRRGTEAIYVLPAIVFLVVEALAQFPWQNPFPVYFSALLVGLMAVRIWPEGSAARNPAKWLAGACGIFLLGCFVWGEGVRIIGASRDYARVALACRLQPADSYCCNRAARGDYESGNYAEARGRLAKVLAREPANYTALRLMSGVAQKQGNLLEACFYLWRYDDLFYERSSMHRALTANCPERFLSYFRRKRPMVYYSREPQLAR
jgi:hypothetical protein